MVVLSALWIPIVVSAVVIFFASYFVWMVLPHHKTDWKRLPDEDGVMGKLREKELPPGQYSIPHCIDMKEAQKPEIKEKFDQGPVAYLTVGPSGFPNMGKNLGLTFVYYLVISLFVAYLSGRVLAPGADYLAVFQIAGTAAVLGYAGALVPQAIWFSRPWSNTFKEIVDGVIYGLLTAGIFGWLWPS